MYKIFVCSVLVFAFANAFPNTNINPVFRLRRSPPKTAIMFGSYYTRPSKRNSEFMPIAQNGMSAFVVGDTVGTSSYVGGLESNPNPNIVEAADSFEEEQTEKVFQNAQDYSTTPFPLETTPSAAEELLHPDVVTETTISKKEFPKKRAQSKPVVNKEEDDTEDTSGFWPFKVNGRGQPVYNAFFPIMLGSLGSRSRVRSSEEGEELPSPGAATAIANSFSTGKGGVATSHATSYGDPYLSTLLRSGFSFNKNKNLHTV